MLLFFTKILSRKNYDVQQFAAASDNDFVLRNRGKGHLFQGIRGKGGIHLGDGKRQYSGTGEQAILFQGNMYPAGRASFYLLFVLCIMTRSATTALPAKSDSDVMFCLQLLSKTLTCTHHLS